MIDKTSERWMELPWWVKASFWGSNMPVLGMSRRALFVRAEMLAGAGILVAVAYYLAVTTRMGDHYRIW
ncbi:MAG: hypothetical protein ABW190_09880 [Rhizobacter sp.]